jgi:hypothetical protein
VTDVQDLLKSAQSGVPSDPITRQAVALEGIHLELSAIRVVLHRQAKATKELAEMVARDLDRYDLDDDGNPA